MFENDNIDQYVDENNVSDDIDTKPMPEQEIIEESKVEEPKVEEPKVEEPVVEKPKIEEEPIVEPKVSKTVGGFFAKKDTVSEKKAEKPVKEKKSTTDGDINLYQRFDVRFGYSIDSRATTGHKVMSVGEMVKQFIKAPTCFIALETKENLELVKKIVKRRTFTFKDKDNKDVEFTAVDRFITRIEDHTNHWISKNSK